MNLQKMTEMFAVIKSKQDDIDVLKIKIKKYFEEIIINF